MHPSPSAEVFSVPSVWFCMTSLSTECDGTTTARSAGDSESLASRGLRTDNLPMDAVVDARMDRDALAGFLRRRREAITPAEVGLPDGARRRTVGLRREEVAQLAGMSADYYGRLEQARSTQPSTQMVRAMARALRLSEDETDHLYLLAGHSAP